MKKTVIAALVLGGALPSLLAQERATKMEGYPRIAVIDMQRVSSESLLGKSYASQLEGLQNEINAEGTKKQAELQKMDNAIKALQEELEKQGAVLSEEARDKKRLEIVKKTRDRQAFLEDGQAELQRMRERAQQQAQSLNQEFQVKIKPHIEAVAKDKNIDIIIDSQAALILNRDWDISRDVIVKADDAERTAKAGGQPAAAKPAPTPSPAPKP